LLDQALSPDVEARLLELLAKTFVVIEPDVVPTRVEITADADACLALIDATSREGRAEETRPEGPEQDFSGLLDHAARAGIRIDIQMTPDGVRFSWRLPLSAPVHTLPRT